jgi:HEAT repeat protein
MDLVSCYDILPHVSVTKQKCLLPLFREYLDHEERDVQLLAVCALGAIGHDEAVPWLLALFEREDTFHGAGCQKLQTNILHALGEIGHDSASIPLMELFDRQIPRDNFRRKRRLIIIESLESIARQGGGIALRKLVECLDHDDFLIRATAVTSISGAFWHRPNELPEEIFNRLLELLNDRDLYVQYSLISALENLADIGCERAADLFSD